MAFIYEKLTEEDKGFFDSFGFFEPPLVSPFFQSGAPTHWVSDREREIYLVCLGGQGYRFDYEYPPTYYYLIWQGQLIKIETYRKGEGDMMEGKEIIYKLTRIIASENLSLTKNLLIETIMGVFETYERGRYKKVNSIEFVEISTPLYANGGMISD